MNHHDTQQNEEGLLLSGLDGANPLGFLAALGTLCTLSAARPQRNIKMRWHLKKATCTPEIIGWDDNATVGETIAEHIGCAQCGRRPESDTSPQSINDTKRSLSEKRFQKHRTALKKARDSIKARGMRGKAREDAEARELTPMNDRLEKRRKIWLIRLRRSVPSPELALGKHLNASIEELREQFRVNLAEASLSRREVVDLLSAFGSDVCPNRDGKKMAATPFCFTSGSGHQYFLDSIRQLLESLAGYDIHEVLINNVERRDERLSMRWNPIEDRRYAMMWDDPTAQDNKATTNWVLNLLAYRGLQLYPSVPTGLGLATPGWSRGNFWAWPIWDGYIGVDIVRSTLAHVDITNYQKRQSSLQQRGIVAIYESRRILVGTPPLHKINFTPSRRIV